MDRLEACMEKCKKDHCMTGGRFCSTLYWICVARCDEKYGDGKRAYGIGSWLLAGLL